MRAAIFIDGAYILSHLKQYDLAPDYPRLSDFLIRPLRKSGPLDLLRCYFYYAPPYMSPEPTDAERRRMAEHETFMTKITALERWSVRLGKLQRRWDGHRETFEQKRVDVLLSVDMVRHSAAGHIQHAVVVAGDSDFIPAIDAAKDSGATVTLWCGAENTVHRDLVEMSDIVHRIDWKKFPSVKIKSGGEGPLQAVRKKIAVLVGDAAPRPVTVEPAAPDQPKPSSGRRRRRPRRKPE